MPKLARIRYVLLTASISALLVACCVKDATPQQGTNQTIAPTAHLTVVSTAYPTVIPTVHSTVIPTVHSDVIDVEDLVAGQAISYRGITPGVSRKSDVLAKWGEPNVIRRYEAYESLHYFIDRKREYFLIKNDIVQAVTSSAEENWLVRDGRPATDEDLQQVLGSPEVITPTLGGFFRQVFPEYGLAVPMNYVPYPYQFFVPMSLQEYQELWGDHPLECDPFPLIPSVEDVGIKVGETTRSQVEQLLGPPDRIVVEDPNAFWVYYVEPDLLRTLDIFFDSDDVVEHMRISSGFASSRHISLNDIVDQYGEPDILELLRSEDGLGYESLWLVYLSRGMEVATHCVSKTCEIVRRDARVIRKWYFEPTTPEEYKAQFPAGSDYASTFIEWHGFDE